MVVSEENTMLQKLIAEIKEQARHDYVSPSVLQFAYLGLGENERALTLLRTRLPGARLLVDLVESSILCGDPLRSEPRFQTLLYRMNFPQ
jgi:hypothetical protein